MSLALFRFDVENLSSRERTSFIGQGDTLQEDFAEGLKNVNEPFRPKQDGKFRPPTGLAVRTAAGQVVTRQVKEFESQKDDRS